MTLKSIILKFSSIMYLTLDLEEKNIKLKRSVCEKGLVDFDVVTKTRNDLK